MILEVFDRRFKCVQTAEFESSSWDNHRIRYMAKNGYSFRLDGRWIAIGSQVDTYTSDSSSSFGDMTLDELKELARQQLDKYVEEHPEEAQAAADAAFAFAQELINREEINSTGSIVDPAPRDECDSTDVDSSDSEDDVESTEISQLSTQQESQVKTKTMIECIETGQIWAKQAHAARELGLDPSYVSDSIKTGKTYKGYTFRKVERYI